MILELKTKISDEQDKIAQINQINNEILQLNQEIGFQNKNIEGIIVGKAIYDEKIKLDDLAKEIDA